MIEKLLSPEVITAAASAVAAVTALVVAIVNGVRAVKLERQIEAAKQRETYIVCPHCGKKAPLSEVSFRLPDGSLDNNLNGKPDVLE